MGEYYEVSEYTVEDFAQARFAEHPDTGQTACRIAGADGSAWTTEDGADATDASMARDRWVPVVEADGPVVTEGTLRHVEERAERKRERLIRHISDLEGTIRRRGAALEDLREPWADLADVLRAITEDPVPDETARMLYEYGVTVSKNVQG